MTTRAAAAAAGNEIEQYGWWSEVTANISHQRPKGVSGYNSKSQAAKIGMDLEFSQDNVVGAAVGYATGDVKYIGDRTGNTASAKTTMLSLYGSHNISNNIFVTAMIDLAASRVKYKELRDVNRDKVALATYDTNYHSIAGYIGYCGGVLTPYAGIRYQLTRDSDYQETGTTIAPKKIERRSGHSSIGTIGTKVTRSYNLDGVTLQPELSLAINYDFIHRNPNVRFSIDGMDQSISVSSQTPEKLSGNIGAGMTMKFDGWETAVKYDYGIQRNRYSHTGSVKVRLVF